MVRGNYIVDIIYLMGVVSYKSSMYIALYKILLTTDITTKVTGLITAKSCYTSSQAFCVVVIIFKAKIFPRFTVSHKPKELGRIALCTQGCIYKHMGLS